MLKIPQTEFGDVERILARMDIALGPAQRLFKTQRSLNILPRSATMVA